LETTGSPAHQRGLSADDGATAGHGVVAAEVFRWADNRRKSIRTSSMGSADTWDNTDIEKKK